ncbi:MAG: hypothetical protein ACHQ6U_06855 [Thermodesulfobacteriota bacterium]
MTKQRIPFNTAEENEAIRSILKGTSTETGEAFFASLVENLSKVLHTHGAWVTEYLEETKRLRSMVFFLGDQWIKDFEYPIVGTPCEVVVQEKRLVHVRDNLFDKFHVNPELKDFRKTEAVSFSVFPSRT